MITTEDKKEIREEVDIYLAERANSNRDYFLNQRDKSDLVEKIKDTKIELIEKINEVKIDLIDRIGKSQNSIIGWILGGLALATTILGIFIRYKP